ncbi:MAG TPA: 50S ribosomal protein L6, partial [Thermoanaerobaculia bacterium]
MPIQVPSGTKVEIKEGRFTAQGPKGKVEQSLFDGYPVEMDGNVVTIARQGDSGPERSKHGLLRALLANAVQGASAGFSKQLDIVGVGYRAEVKGTFVQFALGYSHPVLFDIPQGIHIAIDAKANRITVTGADRQQ